MFEQVKTFIADYRLYHRTLDELRSLSDRDLADLSLSRADIAHVARDAVLEARANQKTARKPLRNRRAFA